MATLWQDIRYELRMLARDPAFAGIVVVILAVGIGATTAAFSVINAVVLRPLPYQDPDRIVIPWQRTKGIEFPTPIQNFLFLREQNQAFEHLAGYTGARFYVTGIDRPHQSWAVALSPSLFPLLGVSPLLGRTFLSREEQPGNERVVVVSHAFWRDELGGAPDAVGKILTLDDQSFTIVGVMPPEFRFPPPPAQPLPFCVPLVLEGHGVRQIARLKPGVTLTQARAEMAVLTARLREMDPAAHAEVTGGVDRLLDRTLQGNGRPLWLMLGAAGCVLLIACGNVAHLFLARAGVRQREMAMRMALGASRFRVVRQILTESLLLSLGAGLLGLGASFGGVQGLLGLCPANVPRLQETRVDTSVLLFTLGASVLTGLLFGMVPAWRASDVRTAEALKQGRGSSASSRGGRHLRAGLVVAQISVSLVLLMGAGLLLRSLWALQKADLGFRPEKVLTVRVELPRVKYPEPHHCRTFFESLLQQVRALPGVRAAGLVSPRLNLGTGGSYDRIQIDDQPPGGPDGTLLTRVARVGPGFFEAMGIHVLRGRVFTGSDARAETQCAVIDENLARTCFPDTDPLGHKINGRTIVGVVSTLRDFETLTPTRDTFFTPLSADWYFQISDLVVRTEDDPMRWASAIRSQVSTLDKEQTAYKVETLETRLSRMLAPRRFTMILLGLFAGIALVLAMMGVYGLLHYSTTQQTHDIGIRMALGARRIDILRAVVGQGLKLTLMGIVIGLAGVLVLTRVISSLLYGVNRTDPMTFACVSLLLTGMALVASYLPARRAARIDPMAALRHE